MDLTVLYSETYGRYLYEECIDPNADKTMLGNDRLILRITITYPSPINDIDIEGGILISDPIGDIIISDTFLLSELFDKYTHKPLIEFDQVIIRLDASSNDGVITFDVDDLKGIDDIQSLTIQNESAIKHVNIKCSLSDTDKPTLKNISLLRFENCIFPEGVLLYDRTKILLEFVTCDIYDTINLFENREPMPISVLNATFESCNFYDMKTFLISRLINLTMRDCMFINHAKPEDYYEIERPLEDYINPTFKIDGCEYVEITGIMYQNIFSGLEIANCKSVTMCDVNGTHVTPSKPVSKVIGIHDCDDVVAADIKINGLVFDNCKNVSAADMHISKQVCANAAFGIRCTRIGERLSLAAIQPEENTVVTGIVVSMCESEIAIVDSIISKGGIGISINGCQNTCTIINGILTDIGEYAILLKSVFGDVKIVDTTIMRCPSAISCVEGKSLQLMGTIINGKSPDGPIRENREILAQSLGEFKLLSGTNCNGVSVKIDTVDSVETQDVIIERSYVDISSAETLILRKTLVSANDVPSSRTLGSAFLCNSIAKLEIHDSLFKDFIPEFKFIQSLQIKQTSFFKGIILYYAGDYESEFSENNIGDPDSPAAYDTGIEMTQCNGILFKKNVFTSTSSKVAYLFNQCMCIIIDDSNEYSVADMQIPIAPHAINNNHFILGTKNSEVNQPKVVTPSCFRELLYFFAKSEYFKRYTDPPKQETVDEVFGLHTDIVSYIDRNDLWVPSYISKVNENLKTISKSIS